jgi:hypothetical protein
MSLNSCNACDSIRCILVIVIVIVFVILIFIFIVIILVVFSPIVKFT